MDDVTRLQDIQETIADERERIERGDDGRLEPQAIWRLVTEAHQIADSLQARGIHLTEAQYEAAAKRKDFAAYEYSRIKDNTELRGKIEELRQKGDVVGLYLITSQMPPGAMRSMAERPLVDTQKAIQEVRGHLTRINHLRTMTPEKRRQVYEYKQGLPTVDDLVERKRRQMDHLL
jgi:hypothetical protein